MICIAGQIIAQTPIYNAKQAENILDLDNTTSQYDSSINLDTLQILENMKNRWQYVWCERDRFENYHKCAIFKQDVMLLKVDGLEYLTIGKNHYPNRTIALKIDDNPTRYSNHADGLFKLDESLLNEMQTGQTLYYRYREFPYDYNIDKSISLKDFNQTYHDFIQRYYEIK